MHSVAAGGAHLAQDAGAEHGAGAGEHLGLAAGALQFPGVAVELHALEQSEQTAAVLAVEDPADGADLAVEGAERGLAEPRAEHGVGILDQQQVAVLEMGQHPGDGLVEGAGLLVRVALGEKTLGAVRDGDLGGGVGAVVGHHDDQVGTPGLPPQALDRVGDAVLLVVGRYQRQQALRAVEFVGCGVRATSGVPVGARRSRTGRRDGRRGVEHGEPPGVLVVHARHC